MPHVVIVGLSHHTAPLDVREKIALSPGELPGALAHVRAQEGVREAVIVSTCNRSEIVAFTGGGDHTFLLASEDRGAAGFADNFAWDTLFLGVGRIPSRWRLWKRLVLLEST